MARYCIVEQSTGHIINIVEWDGTGAWTPPQGCDVRAAKAGDERYIPPTAPDTSTSAQKLSAATNMTISEIKSALA